MYQTPLDTSASATEDLQAWSVKVSHITKYVVKHLFFLLLRIRGNDSMLLSILETRHTLISPIILSDIWHSAAFPYIKEARKVAKHLEQKFIFQIGTLNHHGINKCFSFN